MVKQMWEIVTTLTEEAQKAALAKCKELGLDPNKGEIPLQESFINLNAARLSLMDAIEKDKLIQLPLTVQKTLLSELQDIARFQTELINGVDHVVNFVSAVEALHFNLWQYRLPYLSEEVLGFETKMNQLKKLDLEAVTLKGELEGGLALKATLQQLLEEVQRQSTALQTVVATAEQTSKKINDDLAGTNTASQKVAAILATAEQHDATATQLAASTKASNAEVVALEPKIKEFFSQIDQYRTKITSTADDAQNAVQKNKTETDGLITTLQKLEDEIKIQIQKATGHSLFLSFQKRKESLVRSKRLWASTIFVLILISLGVTINLIYSVPKELDVAFYLKLSMTIPIIFLLTFCTIQYSRERRLEEEYAFKANISISLVPYQELVDKLTDKSNQPERERYAAFMIDTITRVFTSPTDKVFDSDWKHDVLNDKTIKKFSKLLETITKAAKP